MPPRRMGSISVVVVFSSRLNFSGGPEPPSPAARLLPGPDMAAAAGAVRGLPRNVRQEAAALPSPAEDGEHRCGRAGAPQPQPFPAPTCCIPPSPPRAPHLRRDQPSAAILDFTRRHPASPALSAGARGNAGCGGTAFPVPIGCALSLLSGFFRTSLFLSDWPVGVPMVTEPQSHARPNDTVCLSLETLEKRGALCNLLRTRILF